MGDYQTRFGPFFEKMRSANVPDPTINLFRHYYFKMLDGRGGLIPESNIQPVGKLAEASALPEGLVEAGQAVRERTLIIKLNGGLGTTMGLAGAKSLLKVKDNLTFLDIIAEQAIREGLPLVLMNSLTTRPKSLERMRARASADRRIPRDFLQSRVPKIEKTTKAPVEWPPDPELEWYPPGHGELYTALRSSGLLRLLLQSGYRYVFVSNADNLGATLDLRILGFFASKNLDFLMEVTERTEADRKGGHLARFTNDGRLLLRELAQCPVADQQDFQDRDKYRYFNTNNLWLNLETLEQTLRRRQDLLGLSMICNEKTVDPSDPASTPVLQLETAMGAAISIFEHSEAMIVPRTRFLPVKTSSDLLTIRSDLTIMGKDSIVRPNAKRALPAIFVDLDQHYYRTVGDLELRFPFGPPSLIDCRNLSIKGDFRFGRSVVLKGDVVLVNENPDPISIPDRTVLADHRGTFSL